MQMVVLTLLFLFVIAIVERRTLKRSSKWTQLVYYGVLVLSGAIWVYVFQYPNAERPTEWVRKLLSAVDPLR